MAEVADPLHALQAFKPPAAAAEQWQDFEATIGALRLNAARGWIGFFQS
jgi:hypothetical protein